MYVMEPNLNIAMLLSFWFSEIEDTNPNNPIFFILKMALSFSSY